jgi:uncharacterized protein
MPIPTFPFLHPAKDGTLIDLYVQPRASKSEMVGVHEGSLRVRLAAPPVDGEANRECVKFLSKLFDVPKSHVEIVQGLKSRRKSVLLRGLSLESARETLLRAGIK